MINIRYHIVSITAVFLALGIGVALGSTFLDRATVGRLDANISDAQERIAATEAENSRLQAEVDAAQARDLAQLAASGAILDGRLEDRPVLLVAAPGVDQANIDALTLILGNASADVRGTLVLHDGLAFPDGVDDDLAEALDLRTTRPAAQAAEVQEMLLDALVAAGAPAEEADEGEDGEPGDGTTEDTSDEATTSSTTVAGETAPPDDTATTETTTTTTTTLPDADENPSAAPSDDAPDGETPEILTALVDADLVDLAPGPGAAADDPVLEETGYLYVYVTQPGLDPVDDEVLLVLLPPVETDPPLPAVVVSPSVEQPDDEPRERSAVEVVRSSDDLSRLYSTVDDIDTYIGLQSTVLVLAAPAGASAGHYGQGEGATALMPAGS